jgi:hypothetical protein
MTDDNDPWAWAFLAYCLGLLAVAIIFGVL